MIERTPLAESLPEIYKSDNDVHEQTWEPEHHVVTHEPEPSVQMKLEPVVREPTPAPPTPEPIREPEPIHEPARMPSPALPVVNTPKSWAHIASGPQTGQARVAPSVKHAAPSEQPATIHQAPLRNVPGPRGSAQTNMTRS